MMQGSIRLITGAWTSRCRVFSRLDLAFPPVESNVRAEYRVRFRAAHPQNE